ncbi:MAG: class I SAM-dependent methyltransferase [Pseudomonadota bacterium]
MADEHEGHLGAVYAATTPKQVAALYDAWAATYEMEMARAGYRHPSIGVALLTRYLPRGAAPLLDAGAGTGLVGEWLGIVGYPVVEALDISTGMLRIARAKGIYAAFHQVALGGPLPFAEATYAGIISTGVFTTGHVGPEALDELIRICRPGGVIVLTVKDGVWGTGFSARLAALIDAGRIAMLEETPPYISMPGETGTSPSRAIALRVTP